MPFASAHRMRSSTLRPAWTLTVYPALSTSRTWLKPSGSVQVCVCWENKGQWFVSLHSCVRWSKAAHLADLQVLLPLLLLSRNSQPPEAKSTHFMRCWQRYSLLVQLVLRLNTSVADSCKTGHCHQPQLQVISRVYTVLDLCRCRTCEHCCCAGCRAACLWHSCEHVTGVRACEACC